MPTTNKPKTKETPKSDESLLPVPQIHEEVHTGPLYRREDGRLEPIPDTDKKADLNADPRAEYVAGGPFWLAASYLRTLAFAIDDITADFGDDLYDRMLFDGQVYSDVNTLILSILADGINLLPAVDRWETDPESGERTEHPRWKQAQEIQQFCERNLCDLTTAFDPNTASALYWALYEMLRGIAYGNKIAEKVYTIAQTGVDTGRLILSRMKVKPRRNAAFVVDPYKNLKGIVALIPGSGFPVMVQSLLGDPKWIPNLLPRRKFAVFTFRPIDADPRGSSILRACYDAWFVKQQIKQERLAYLARFQGGSVWGSTAEGGEPVPSLDTNGNQIYDPATGLPVILTPEGAMMQGLIQWRNGSVLSVPFGAMLHVEYPPAQNPFEDSLDAQNREITQAILGQTRATHEAQHGSRADSDTGQDILGLNVAHGKAALALMIRNDILLDLVEFNFGPDALDLIPKVVLSETQQHDFATAGATVASLKTADYFAPSQLTEVDAMLGLPVRTAAEAQQAAEAQAAGVEALRAKTQPTEGGKQPANAQA